jgi:hypothetical protein
MEEIKEENKFEDLLADWLETGSNNVKSNPLYLKLLLHTLLGQMFKHVRITKRGNAGDVLDGRINMCVIQPQGTGKGLGGKFLNEMCILVDGKLKRLNGILTNDGEIGWVLKYGTKSIPFTRLRVYDINDFTDAGIIGSFEQKRDEKDKVIRGKNGKVVYEQVYGAFSRMVNDIFIFEESSVLSSKSQHKENVFKYINSTFDSLHKGNRGYALLQKPMRGDTVKCATTISGVFMQHPGENMGRRLVESGFYRRVPTLYNDISEDIMQSTAKDIFIADKPVSNDVIIKQRKNICIKLIGAYFEFLYRNEGRVDIEISYDDNVQRRINQFIDTAPSLWSSYKRVGITGVGKTMQAITTSYIDHMLKIAAHRALVEGRQIIVEDDISYAEQLIDALIERLVVPVAYAYGASEAKIQEATKGFRDADEKILKKIEGIYKEKAVRELKRVELLKLLEDSGMKQADARYRLRRLIENGSLTIIGKQNYDATIKLTIFKFYKDSSKKTAQT